IVGISKIARDIGERKRIEEALRRGQKELGESGRRKDEFLAMLAHELRNPLAPMRLAAETMRAAGSADETVAFGAAVIDRQVTHLARLVDDLLDVSRISRGLIAIEKEPIDLAEAVEMALELARPLMEEREHRLAVQPPPGPVYVEGDADRLAQVFANLLNNAAKFTARGGTIALSTGIDGGEAFVRVKDGGAGISAALLPHIFDLFFQADTSLARQFGGMGIGLALARRLVELHGGTLEAKSEGEGKGAEFTVRLPRRDAPPAAAAAEAAAEEPAPRPGYRILIVDDNADAAEITRLFLEVQGHEARSAFDGKSALRIAPQFRPQLVLLDIGMPGMDGYEVARRLREAAGPVRPVIVALTGYGSSADLQRSTGKDLDRYLVKPVDPQALLELIAGLG
ncbi:MAG: hybrid sensor histidine kinase/response regulator, partial [Betaproteobacteria bacterium]